jgi:hypothetical protein
MTNPKSNCATIRMVLHHWFSMAALLQLREGGYAKNIYNYSIDDKSKIQLCKNPHGLAPLVLHGCIAATKGRGLCKEYL